MLYPNQKHPWYKKSCDQELEKGLDEKDKYCLCDNTAKEKYMQY